MKRYICAVLTAAMLLGLMAGCGSATSSGESVVEEASASDAESAVSEETADHTENGNGDESGEVTSAAEEADASGNAGQADAEESAVQEEGESSGAGEETPAAEADWELDLAAIDMTQWQYNNDDDVYWQVDISYCSSPADEYYETLGVFIPGSYMNGTDNGDGTYTCTVNGEGAVNGYTAETAPILFPVNTPGHKAQDAPTGYTKGGGTYTAEGFIYVVAGCRGKDAGVPSGVADLKAAIRYIRFNEGLIPGDMDRIVAYGMSGGGSQSAVLGSSGDSELYYPYLEALGAATTSGAVAAVMSWCPITGYDTSDLSYEWNMGMTRTDLTDEMQGISDALAEAYAEYVNETGFTDEEGNVLTLEPSEEGIYQAGSYYEYVKQVIEESLEHYLTDQELSEPEEYIASLNSDTEWVVYDSETGEVTISSIAEFSKHFKKATKPIAAFDKLDEGGHELFNTGDGEKTHYDSVLYEIVKGTAYEAEVAEDLAKTDVLGNDMEYRINMFSPMYYLMETNEGYGTASVADSWRIRTGITQSDTALTTEINLALALNAYGADVDFETVWEEGHAQAERTGDSTENFIAWVHSLWE